jgi:hypothetical protein
MVEVQVCQLDARFSALHRNGLRLFALLVYYGYITNNLLAGVTMATNACKSVKHNGTYIVISLISQ